MSLGLSYFASDRLKVEWFIYIKISFISNELTQNNLLLIVAPRKEGSSCSTFSESIEQRGQIN